MCRLAAVLARRPPLLPERVGPPVVVALRAELLSGRPGSKFDGASSGDPGSVAPDGIFLK